MRPADFFHQHLGRYLYPEARPGEDAVTIALSKNYQHALKPGTMRLGSGKAAALITPERSILMADITVPHSLPPEIDIMPCSWRTIPNWEADVIIDPPKPPFMFVIFGKSPAIQDKLRINGSTDVIEISGAKQLRCRPHVVKSALETIGNLSPTVWRKAVFLNFLFLRDKNSHSAESWCAELEKLETKHPTLANVLAVLPPYNTPDYEAVTLVHATRSKINAARSADEAAHHTE